MKVLLVYPNQPKVATKPSLGLMYLASVLREAGHEPKIVEGPFEAVKKQFDSLPIDFFPDFIGITCMTSQYHEILRMRNYFHQWDIPILFGGPHASILPESLLTSDEHFIDFVVQGEGEKTILQVMDDLYNNRVTPIKDQIIRGELIKDLDCLPFPARDLVSKRYFAHGRTSILASRGCPFNCSFCQPTLRKIFGEKVRRRSPENVVGEMKACFEEFGLDTFEFFDDTFTSDKGWVYEFCDHVKYHHFNLEILSRVDMVDHELLMRLKDVGLRRLSLGIETGSQEILNSYGKGTTVEQNIAAVKLCNELDIKVHGFFMVGALDETEESIKSSKRLLKQVKFETIFVTVTMPMPCTRLYQQAKKQNRLVGDWPDFDYLGNMTTTGGSKSDADSNPMRLKHLLSKEVIAARYSLLRSFYFRKLRNPLYLIDFIRQNSLSYTWNAAKQILRKSYR